MQFAAFYDEWAFPFTGMAFPFTGRSQLQYWAFPWPGGGARPWPSGAGGEESGADLDRGPEWGPAPL